MSEPKEPGPSAPPSDRPWEPQPKRSDEVVQPPLSPEVEIQPVPEAIIGALYGLPPSMDPQLDGIVPVKPEPPRERPQAGARNSDPPPGTSEAGSGRAVWMAALTLLLIGGALYVALSFS